MESNHFCKQVETNPRLNSKRPSFLSSVSAVYGRTDVSDTSKNLSNIGSNRNPGSGDNSPSIIQRNVIYYLTQR
jgi:hypothetical protein